MSGILPLIALLVSTYATIFILCYHSLNTPHLPAICPINPCNFLSIGSQNGSASEQALPESSNLDKEVNFCRTNSFAASTSRTFSAHQMAYLDFCSKSGISSVPISQANLGRYIAYLSRRLAFNSICQYLNIVRLVYLKNGHPNPLSNNWYLSSILKGVRYVEGDASNKKLPIILELLQSMFLKLDMSPPPF